MRRIIIVLVFAGSAFYLSAGTLDDIDQAVEQLGRFVTRLIPDESNQTIIITPFLSDQSGRNLLGDRLKSELELFLAGVFVNTRIIDQPENLNTYSITGEIQAYSGKVRIILKIIKPDGSLGGGTRADLRATPEIEALLLPAEKPGAKISMMAEDPYEPDDSPGFEVEVEQTGIISFERTITPGDIDRFRFYLSQPGTIVLEAVTSMDMQLLLYRDGETIPFMISKPSQTFKSSRIETFLDYGYYVAEITAYDFNVEGEYTLVINLAGNSNDEFEPDNLMENAQRIYPPAKQKRMLLSGDTDWVELSYNQPGFYAVYTTGAQVDTVISLYHEEEKEIMRADNNGGLQNAYLGVFLGTRRIFIKIFAKNVTDSGSYALVFEKIAPLQIYPDGSIHNLRARTTPYYLKLRVLQSGNYIFKKQGEINPVALEIFSLPNMERVKGRTESLFFLSTGDYLLALKNEVPERIRMCVAPEGTAGDCLSSSKE